MGEERSNRGLAGLAALPQMLKNGPLEDLRSIAEGMQVLPELARILREIQVRVDSLDEEVKAMRAAVEQMGADVQELPPRLDELGHTLRPMRRLGRRFSSGAADEEPDPEA